MASAFKRTGRNGKKEQVWTGKYKDHNGKWRTFRGYSTKAETKERAEELEAKADAIRENRVGVAPSWEDGMRRPIIEVLGDYIEWGMVKGGLRGKPWDNEHARNRRLQIENWIATLGLQTLGDIDLARVDAQAAEMSRNGRTNKTIVHRVSSLRALCSWAVQRGYLQSNPLAGFGRMDTKAKNPHRPLNDDEIQRLLAAASPRNRLWYETALATGYRQDELRSLLVRDLDMFGPSMPLGSDYTKDRKDARQPISRALATKLSALAKGKPQDAPLLDISTSKAHSILKTDLKRAGVARQTDQGKATWHSFRKSYINAVVRSGADLKTIMELARHSSATMSMETYATADPALLREAAEAAEKTLNQAPWCAGGAQKVAGAESDAVNTSADNDLQDIELVGARGFEPERVDSHIMDTTAQIGATREDLNAKRQSRIQAGDTPRHPKDTPERCPWCAYGAHVPADLRRLAEIWDSLDGDDRADIMKRAEGAR